MVQVPAATRVKAVSETEQIEALDGAKETARPEEAEAESAKGPVPNVRGGKGLKVMVWEALLNVNIWEVLVADS